MRKLWRSNSNLGSHPFLESVFFLLVGQVKAWEGMPKPLCTHDFHFLTHPHGVLAPSCTRKRLSSLLHGLAIVSLPSPYPGCVLGVSSVNGKEGATILGFEEAVFASVRKLGVLFHVFLHFSYFLQAGKLVFGLPATGRRDPWILGVVEFVLATLGP